MNDGIDFVVTWVDGSDKAWQAQKALYSGAETAGSDGRERRYRDWGLFQYWFRGVEKFAPWVRKVHFITWGHLPEWLNVNHPKLHIVRHEDYIPKEFLPTFNSNVLELYLHKIEGLSERFVYFNDDMFLIRPVKPELFFCGQMPCDMLVFEPLVVDPDSPVMAHIHVNNSIVLSRHFVKRENVKKQPGAYFRPGYPLRHIFYNVLELSFPKFTKVYFAHGPSSFCKSTFQELWEKEGLLLTEVSANRFRSATDVSQHLTRAWQRMTGNFHPCNVRKFLRVCEITGDNRSLVSTITREKKKIVCINDDDPKGDFDVIRTELQAAFDTILPEKSTFEL